MFTGCKVLAKAVFILFIQVSQRSRVYLAEAVFKCDEGRSVTYKLRVMEFLEQYYNVLLE